MINRAEIKLGRIRLLSRPVELTLEPTLECNSNCVMCNRNFSRQEVKKAKGFLDWDVFNKVKPFFSTAERVLFGGFGEPLIHPHYLEMLIEIKKTGPYVYVFSNGILMNEKVGKELVDAGMDMICISMGGSTKETYRKIRGVDAFETVVDNIRRLSDYKKKCGANLPLISWNIVAMRTLLPEMEDIVDLAHKIGVEHIALPNLVAQGSDMETESLWLCRDEALTVFQKAANRAERYGITFIPPNLNIGKSRCHALFNRLNINWDGSIMSCAMERYIAGDLRKQTITEVWNGKSMQTLRHKILTEGLADTCPRCTCWDNQPENFLHPSENSRAFAKEI